MQSAKNKLCVSLLPKSASELEKISEKSAGAIIVELRLDKLGLVDFSKLKKNITIPIIVTLRSPDEGGFWQGSISEQIRLYQNAIENEIDFIDVEYQQADKILFALKVNRSTKIILSHHSKKNDLADLEKLFFKLLSKKADIYKLIFQAENFDDNLKAFRLIELAKSRGVSFIIHAMGEWGTVSRLWGAVLGNEWTFVSAESDRQTAPGQITLETARQDYFLQNKSAKCKMVGLIGYPIKQSRGWRLHNRLLNYKMQSSTEPNTQFEDFLYLNFPVKNIASFLTNWDKYVSGLSVTIPHKEKVLPFVKGKSVEIEMSGACNTIYKSNDGKWHGINADLLAVQELLEPYRDKIAEGVLLIGTGATTRTCITALKKLPAKKIFITGRNTERGETLAKFFAVDYLKLNEIKKQRVGAVIQTTPVGMYPDTEEIPPGTELFRSGMVVFDVIYNPEITRFLKIACERGCITISGREMFLRQALHQFRIYSGVEADLAEIKKIWDEIKS